MKKLKQFLRDTSGNIAYTAAILVAPIMLSVGAAIDYTSYVNQRQAMQNSLDAAGLAAAQQLNKLQGNQAERTAQLKTYAESFLKANLDNKVPENAYQFDLTIIPGDQSIDPPIADRIKLTADLTYETIFGGNDFVDEIEEQIGSIISMGNRTVEVALVLDNSGSMGGSRINTLKKEAKNLVDIVYGSAALTTMEKPVQFSLVPFAASVNIGPENKNKSYMDKKGWSPVHHENFDWENTFRSNNLHRARKWKNKPYGYQEKIDNKWRWKTRHDVFEMLGTEWAGCVEMRPYPHNVLDTAVNTNQNFNKVRRALGTNNGDYYGVEALFVPYFAPDEPDRYYADDPQNSYGEWYAPYVDHRWDDDRYNNDYLYDFHDYNPSNGNRIQLYTDENNSNYMYGKRGSSDQVLRTNALFKYQANNQYRGSLHNYHGPNDGCTTRPIMELTDNPDEVKDEIDLMQATGTTNIQQGITWGWRTLSPGEPFTTGREKDDRHNLKIVVVLTDGNNFYSSDGDSTPNNTGYGAWGYARPDNRNGNNADDKQYRNAFTGEFTHNRWAKGLTASDLQDTIYSAGQFDLTPESGSEFSLIMDAHTNQACNNVRADGVTIFAVAFDVPQSGGVRDLLQACAGTGFKNGQPVMSSGEFYFDVDQGGLEAAFTSIARQIANLRIAG